MKDKQHMTDKDIEEFTKKRTKKVKTIDLTIPYNIVLLLTFGFGFYLIFINSGCGLLVGVFLIYYNILLHLMKYKRG